MPNSSRSLRLDFVVVLSECIPASRSTLEWMRKHGHRMQTVAYLKMVKGEPSKPDHVRGFVAYMLHKLRTSPECLVSQTVQNFVEANFQQDATLLSDQELHECLVAPKLPIGFNGARSIVEAIHVADQVEEAVDGCKTECQVREAGKWLFVWAAHEICPQAFYRGEQTLIDITEAALDIKLVAYQNALVRWWRKVPWSVVRARGNFTQVGMSVVLPLTKEAYRLVKTGELGVMQIEAEHLCQRSRHLFIGTFAQRTTLLEGEQGIALNRILAALFVQVSILARTDLTEDATPLHMLTAIGSESNKLRIERMGYDPLDAVDRSSRLPLFERVFREPLTADQKIELGTSMLMGKEAERYPVPPSAPYPKQKSRPISRVEIDSMIAPH